MKNTSASALFILGAFSLISEGQTLDVFLLLGQSNAVGTQGQQLAVDDYQYDPADDLTPFRWSNGSSTTASGGWLTMGVQNDLYWGAEITASRTLRDLGYNPAFIKVAKAGTSLDVHWDSSTPGSRYTSFVNNYDIAISDLNAQGTDYNVRGVFWVQGESDGNDLTTAQAYEDNFSDLVSAVRTKVGNPETIFVTALTREKSDRPHRLIVREAQTTVMATSPFSSSIETNSISVVSDNNHYDSAGLEQLGVDFAMEFHRIASVPEPTTSILGIIACLFYAQRRHRLR